MAASEYGHLDCVKLLLDGGAKLNHHDEVGTVQGQIQGIWTCMCGYSMGENPPSGMEENPNGGTSPPSPPPPLSSVVKGI